MGEISGRDICGDLGLGDEGHDAEHGEAAVVDLGEEALLLLLRRGVLREPERVEELERHLRYIGLQGGAQKVAGWGA